MKRILLITVLGLGTLVVNAQAESDVFYFRQIASKIDETAVNKEIVRDHFLGDEIALKLQILKDSYTYVEPESATQGSPRLIIDKPEIYNNVKKIEKFYKKSIKEGVITEQEAAQEYGYILDIAIYIRNQKTTEFEAKLRSLKSDSELVTLFTKSVRLENY